MRAGALRRIQPPVRIGDSKTPDQQYPVERDLEPAVSAQAEQVREVSPKNLKERVDRIVVHDCNLIGLGGSDAGCSGIPANGLPVKCPRPDFVLHGRRLMFAEQML
jgi:hypothetical protein